MTNNLNAEDFGLIPDTGKDSTYLLAKVLEQCRKVVNPILKFSPGRYDFWPDLALERQIFISNHDQDIDRRIAFPLFNFENITIDGNGARFVFHGVITPFVIDSCSDVTLKSFCIDWETPFIAQGIVVDSGKDWFDIKMDSCHTYKIKNKKLVIMGENCEGECEGMNEFSTKTFGPVPENGDDLNPWRELPLLEANEITKDIVRFRGPISRVPEKENAIVIRWGKRHCPGIFIQESNNIVLKDIIIHHAGGMGIIAQRTKDIIINAVKVKIPDNTGRLFTLLADATHFVYCSGRIEITDCLFENQLDDACNVHGIYAQIFDIINRSEIIVRLVHPQQQGIVIAKPGETIAFVDNINLLTYAQAKVQFVQKINREFYKIALESDVPEQIRSGHVVENNNFSPDLIFKDCVIRNNRARGILVTSKGKIVIQNNDFNVTGSAIKISGDANFWFESGAVKDITIENNIFNRLNICNDWGNAVIDIDPEIRMPESSPGCYHDNIKIVNNEFNVKDSKVLYAKSASNLVFAGNNIKNEGNMLQYGNMFDISGCRDVKIEA